MKKLLIALTLCLLTATNGFGFNSKDKNDPIIKAIESGDINAIKNMLNNGLYVDSRDDNNGNTMLMVAAEHGNVEICKLLINKGAKVNAKASMGFTPLLMAIGSENTDSIVTLLLQNGAHIDQENNGGVTALDLAVCCEKLSTIKLLLDNGANVDGNIYTQGLTPIMYAVSGIGVINEKMTKLLINYGADVNIKTSDGESVLSMAKDTNNKNLIKILEDAGATE